MYLLSEETVTLILRLLGSRSATQGRTVSRAFNRAALRAVPYDIDPLPTAARWNAFFDSLFSQPVTIDYSRHLTVKATAFDDTTSASRQARQFLQRFMRTAKNLVSITLIGDCVVENLFSQYDLESPIADPGFVFPALQRLAVPSLCLELWHPFRNITHLSLSSHYHQARNVTTESETRSLTTTVDFGDALQNFNIFPVIKSFTGSLSGFIALSHCHTLDHVVLSTDSRSLWHAGRVGRPDWISSWSDLDEFLRALQRVGARSVVAAFDMPDIDDRWNNLWGQLSRAAPQVEFLGLTIAAENTEGQANQEGLRQQSRSARIGDLKALRDLRYVWIHLVDYGIDIKWDFLDHCWKSGYIYFDVHRTPSPQCSPPARKTHSLVRSYWTEEVFVLGWELFLLRTQTYREVCASGWRREESCSTWIKEPALDSQALTGNMFVEVTEGKWMS